MICAMNKGIRFMTMMAAAWLLVGCSSAFYAASNSASNDLYAVHNRTEIARKQQAEAEARKAEAEARRAEWEAMIAEAAAKNAEVNYRSGSTGDSYRSVLADDYESAYARRLRGFESPTYRMPSSYTNARYSSTFHYVSAYDPAFYNIIIMGDEVWVEPKYVTAMFGSWGLPAYSNAWYYGWYGRPSYGWWSYPSYSIGLGGWGWSVGLSWYDPWFYSSWGYPWWGVYRPAWSYPHHHPAWGPGPGGHHHHHHSHGIVHRPTGPNRTHTYHARPNINRGQSGNRQWNSGVYQGGNNSGNRKPSGTVNRTPNNGRGQNSGNSGNWNSNSGNSQRRSAQSGGYNNSSYGNSSRGSSSYGNSYGGSSGGSSRGGYSGSSSRGR